MVDLVVCVATEFEGSLLRPHVPVVCTGIGAVNAAYALTRFLDRELARAVIVCGIAGAYPRAFSEEGLSTGSVVCAESECYGDLGAQSSQGFLDLRAIGFPLIATPRPVSNDPVSNDPVSNDPIYSEPIYNVLPLQIFPAPRRARFVTMNTCAGDDESAQRIEARTGGSVESMEGAAIAHVATLFGIPAGEIRGISNRAGNRDRGKWRVQEAAAAAQHALLAWIEGNAAGSSGV
jgi:futalosine hydrolase